MDLKVGGLGTKWNTLLNKGALIAKDGLDFVNKQLTEIKTTISQNSMDSSGSIISGAVVQHSHDHKLFESHVASSSSVINVENDPITSALASHQLPIFYYYQATICPTQCTTCRPFVDTNTTTVSHFQDHYNGISLLPPATRTTHLLSLKNDNDMHVFFLPQSIQSIDQLTVKQLKELLPPSITSPLVSSSLVVHSLIHLRFKLMVPSEDQDLFTDHIWLDVQDCETPPTYKGSIHVRILQLHCILGYHHHHPHLRSPCSQSHLILQPSLVPSSSSSSTNTLLQSKKHSNTITTTTITTVSSNFQVLSSSPSTSGCRTQVCDHHPPLGSSEQRFDLLLGSNGNAKTVLSSSSPPGAIHPSLVVIDDATQLNRATLISERESRQEARIQEAVNEQAARREREIADAKAKFTASEKLKERLDRWALTSDGQYKDLRALLSSLPDVS